MPPPILLLLNLTFSAMLTGLVWLVQLVQYPGLKLIGEREYQAYQQHHMGKISYIVVPLMLGELLLAIWLLFTPLPLAEMNAINYTAFGCLLMVWLITFGLAVPLHRKLEQKGHQPIIIHKLIRFNWFRTIGWSLRTILYFLLVWYFL